MIRIFAIISALMLTACDVAFQTTSGADYLSRGEMVDPATTRLGNYEPQLAFPARIGVIRLVYDRISTIPAAERTLFSDTVLNFPGDVVHLGELDALMHKRRNHNNNSHGAIRELAASRHLDYVLIVSYDPGRNSAEALFLDVRSGYPYASIGTVGQGRGKSNFWGSRLHNQSRIDASTLRLARLLKPDLEVMIEGLITFADTR